jgi:hypothetical protein
VKNKLDKEKFLSAPWTSWATYILGVLKRILMLGFKWNFREKQTREEHLEAN